MTFKVVLLPDADDFYHRAQQPVARKLARCFARLEPEPRRGGNIKRLSGSLSEFYRYRVGDYRVL